MTQETAALTVSQKPQQGLFDLPPNEIIAYATNVANAMVEVIEKQKLYVIVSGKKHVKVEGWATLGTILGFLPREVEVKELADGSYEAKVELVNVRSGMIVGQGSAICSVEEKRWGQAEKFARRSMAITRATGKAYRLGFAWVMTLAGFEGCPAEEMEDFMKAPQVVKPKGYDPNDKKHVDALFKELLKRNVPDYLMDDISVSLKGKSYNELDMIIAQVVAKEAEKPKGSDL